MLCGMVLSMLMILLSTLSEIGHLICGNNKNWLLNLDLTEFLRGCRLGQKVAC